MSTIEDTWFLQFADESGDDRGRPWADGTAMAARKASGLDPWDTGCKTTSLVGGYTAMNTMRDKLIEAIAEAKNSGLPFGQMGHVYIAGLRFNPLRDVFSTSNVPFSSGTAVDATVLGLILRLMRAGIKVRALFWLPPFIEGAIGDFGAHAAEHFWLAEMVKHENELLMKNKGLTSPIGIVGLDMRLPELTPQAASHHQKMMVIRVGSVNAAFCGGVDLTFTRRDAPDSTHTFDPAHPTRFLAGDGQSGDGIPNPMISWPRQTTGSDIIDYTAVDHAPRPDVKWASDLPVQVYDTKNQLWHDQHLMFEGPIVATLEAQFGERWRDSGRAFDLSSWLTKSRWSVGQVIFSTASAFDAATDSIHKLDPVQPISPLSGAAAKVQMWRTIPLRRTRTGDLFMRGEYTIMAGIAKAMQAANELIWIFDQYFWSCELARLINKQLRDKSALYVIIILPPHADGANVRGMMPTMSHHARRLALEALLDGLRSDQSVRVQVFDLWNPDRHKGIYCHAKVQTYDSSLLVCGSGNLNRRSLSCDSELDCAVLDPPTVVNHQRGLWDMLFPNTPWPSALDLNLSGHGALFFTEFMQAAKLQATNPENPGVFLIRDPWMPGRARQLPTNPPTQLESDPNPGAFSLMYDRILDPNSFLFGPADTRLDRWSQKIESPWSRWLWRTL